MSFVTARFAVVVAAGMCLAAEWSAVAGEKCPVCCEPEKPKKKWFQGPAPAPEAGVAFAIPGVVTRGQAVRVPESAVTDSLKKAVAESASPESAALKGTTEERLEKLERDVSEMKNLMEKLTLAVAKLAE